MELASLEGAKPARRSTITHEGNLYEGVPPEEATIAAGWERGGRVDVELGAEAEPHTVSPPVAAAQEGVPAQFQAAAAQAAGDAQERAHTFCRLACWLALLFAGYGFQQGLCAGGLPYDCDSVNAADVYAALTGLAFAGSALGWLAGVTCPARFTWLASPRRAYLWLVYAALLPAYSGISNISALHSSLSSGGMAASAAMIAVLTLAASALLAVILFHLWLAWRSGSASGIEVPSRASSAVTDGGPPPEGTAAEAAAAVSAGKAEPQGWHCLRWRRHQKTLRTNRGSTEELLSEKGAGGIQRQWRASLRSLWWYLLPRLAVLAYFAAWMAALPASGAFSLHLHHYALGWGLASLAAFNHPVSGVLLSVGTAVFVQGVGSYGLDPFFKTTAQPPGGCLPVASNQTGQMVCAFWAADPFALKFCSDTPWIPWFDCTVPWPWPETALLASSVHQGAAVAQSTPAPAHVAAGASATYAVPTPFGLVPSGEPLL